MPAIIFGKRGEAAAFTNFGLPCLADVIVDNQETGGLLTQHQSLGPLAAILAGLEAAINNYTSQHTHLLICAGDMPFLPPDLVARLQAAIQNHQDAFALASSGAQMHYTCGLWPRTCLQDLRSALEQGVRAVKHFIAAQKYVTVDWPTFPYDPFFNINTREDLEDAEKLFQSPFP